MSLTGRQKKLVIVFALGTAALLVDRLFLRPQGGAHQASAEHRDLGQTVSAVDNLPVLEPESPGPKIAGRLESLWADDNSDFAKMRDPFSMPLSWTHTGPVSTERPESARDVFARSHHLTAVADNRVLMGDRLLVPGQIIDGFTLVAVGKDTAVFQRDGLQVTLKLVNDP